MLSAVCSALNNAHNDEDDDHHNIDDDGDDDHHNDEDADTHIDDMMITIMVLLETWR